MANDKVQWEKQQLMQVLQTANVQEDIQKYVLETLLEESVADFFGLVKADDFEEELMKLLNDNVASQKESPLHEPYSCSLACHKDPGGEGRE